LADTKKSNATKSSTKRSRTNKSYTAPTPPPRPFFDLRYDIRAAICEQVDALPPFSNGIEYAGFVLCCKQAQEEINDFAARRYNKFLEGFKREFEVNTGHDVSISPNDEEDTKQEMSSAPRSLIVTLPYAIFSPPPGNELPASLLSKLNPLMALYLDKLRIHFLALEETRTRRSTFNAMFHAEMRANMWDIAVIIENANTSSQTSLPDPISQTTSLSSSGSGAQRVNCTAICVSWDIRTKQQVRDDAHLIPALRGWRYTRAGDGSEATAGWDVRSEDHAVGEVGLVD
jgi:hypothetical protein